MVSVDCQGWKDRYPLKVSDTTKATTTLIELFKIEMDTSKSVSHREAPSLEGAEFIWNFYAGNYNKDNLPETAYPYMDNKDGG